MEQLTCQREYRERDGKACGNKFTPVRERRYCTPCLKEMAAFVPENAGGWLELDLPMNPGLGGIHR